MTVADVTSPTSCCQLGNGSSMIAATTNVMSSDTQGTPRVLSRPIPDGALPLRAIV